MKTLTKNSVIEHGWDNLSVITAKMIEKYGYTQIGDSAFGNCCSLTSITIPNSVTSIGDYAFYNCHSLTSITIPNSVTTIGNSAFYNCNNLTSINIPNSVTTIGTGAFDCCTSLTSITIPNSVTSIGKWAFSHCGINLSKHHDNKDRLIAYKGFNGNMQCRDFQYAEGKTYETDKAVLCECGFHACTNPLDIFNYYNGEIDKDIFIHEVYLEDVSNKKSEFDSKVVAKKITIGKRLTIEDINKIIQEKYMKVYVAGSFSTTKNRKSLEKMIEIVRSNHKNYELYIPMEYKVDGDYLKDDGTWNLENHVWARDVFFADINAIDNADMLIVLYSGHKGTTGTAFEIGYAYSQNKPVIAYMPHVENGQDVSLMIMNTFSDYMDDNGNIICFNDNPEKQTKFLKRFNQK